MHECLELALKRFRHAITPSFRDRLRTRVGKDLLFTLFKTSEDAGCRCFGRRLRNLQAAVHIRVDGAGDDGMNRDAVSASSALSDCVRFSAAAFEAEYDGIIGRGASLARDTLLRMAPLERFSSGKNALVTPSRPKKLTAKVCSSTSRLLKSS